MLEEKDVFIYETETVKDALKKLDKSSKKVLLVVDKESKLLGTISDGDIRRYILKDKSLDNDIREVYNKKPIFIRKVEFSIDLARKILTKDNVRLIPILNDEYKVIDYITWEQVFSDDKIPQIIESFRIDLPIVIMAGGKGARLEPFNKVFPKPLIPINDKSIIEIIINEFKTQGAKKFYLTLNYKGEMIKLYLDNVEKDYEIKYVWENNFLGTAGSLRLIREEIKDEFIVTNCDVIVKANFREVINFHRETAASLTIISSIQHYKVPYGVIKFKEGGELIDIVEKPEYTFPINTGVYLLNKESLEFIPENTCFDMPDLIKSLIKNSRKIVTYPVNESDYIDIGQWEEYKKAIEKLRLFT